jgi:predicted nucleic acid-binding protein
MRIFIDTSCLRSNILRHSDRKSQKEVTALEQLAERYSLFGSSLTLREVMATTSASQRDSLIVDYNTLQRIPKDEKVLGFHSNGSIVYPLVQDYQDETLRKELIEAGLTPKDAELLVQAVCNNCDVFLTRDENTIIKPYRQWLEQRFPNLRIRLPSELLNELAAPPSAALWHG